MNFIKACSDRMSWQLKAKQAGLLLAGFCLFSLSTCKKDQDEFYLEGVNQYNVIRDTAGVTVTTERMDRVNVTNTESRPGVSSDLVGTYTDPVFGRATGMVYVSMQRDNQSPTFTSGSTINSFTLYIRIHNKDMIGAVNEKHRWFIRELKTKLNNKDIYYSDTTLNASTEYVAYEGTLNPADSMLRIDMNTGTFPGLLSKFLDADKNVFSSDEGFADFFNGLAIMPDTTNPFSVTGAVVALKLNDDSSRLVLKYDGNKTYTMRFGNARVNTYRHNYTGSPVASALNNANSANLYIQSMQGVRLNVQMPELKALAKNQKYALHKAELVFTDIDSNLDAFSGNRPEFVLIAERTEAGLNKASFPDLSLGRDTYYDGHYNSATKTYTLGITHYVQRILNEYYANPDQTVTGLNLYIPADVPLTPARAIFANHGTMRPRLVLTYTKLQE
jgi:hypothetical protein